MKKTQFILFLLVSNILAACRAVDLNIRATTLAPPSNGRPNTFIGTTGDQIASSLLPSKTAAMLWGSVPANVITKVCSQIAKTGRLQYTAKVEDNWGRLESLTLNVVATGGCGAAPDSSGTEFVFIDNYDRRSALVCPRNAGKTGCGVYMTGNDVDGLFHKVVEPKELMLNSSRVVLFDPCKQGAERGAISGAVFGFLETAGCLGLGPLEPFCVIGAIGAVAEIGAAAGCVSASASACFPGDAKVQLSTGETKMMNQLQLGDKVGTLKNGKLSFSEIYAFGHQDFEQESQFVSLETKDSQSLQLSPMHFIPTLLKGNNILLKRAKDVLVGDVLLAVPHNGSMALSRVTKISKVTKKGLFNPLTSQGTIVVNKVLASVHSDWFLDPLFDALGLTALLPAAYQAILFPARLLYALLGQKTYLATYGWIHCKIDIAQFGTKNGGTMFALAGVVGSGIACMLFLKQEKENSNMN